MHDDLLDAARRIRERAYAPYSGYLVGAAVLDEQGRIHSGCNVENVSYGVTICAERSAVSRMVAEGGRFVRAVAVVTKDGGTPCGICLQTLAEFAEDASRLEVVCEATDGARKTFVLSELLPAAFRSASVARTSSDQEGSTPT